jgi:hypothetical protein
MFSSKSPSNRTRAGGVVPTHRYAPMAYTRSAGTRIALDPDLRYHQILPVMR